MSHDVKEANSGKGQRSHHSAEQRWEGDTCSSAGTSGQPERKHLQPESHQRPHEATSCSPFSFIINYCLANKGRVRLKNTGDFKAGGRSWTTVGSQPLTRTINILLAVGLTAATIPAPLLVIEPQTFPRAPQEIQHNQPGVAKIMNYSYELTACPGEPCFSHSSGPYLASDSAKIKTRP